MAKRRKGEQRQGACAYCGAEGLVEMDHVFAETLFVVLDERMVTVPACKICHKEKGAGDADLRDFVNAEINGSRHPNAIKHLVKVARATTRNRSKLGRAFVERGAEQAWETDAGLYLGQVVGVPTDELAEPVLATVGYIVRGLHFHETGERLLPDCPVEVAYVEPHKAAGVLADLKRQPHTHAEIKGDDVAGWVSWRPPDAPLSTQWLIGFNNAVFFLGWTGGLAETRRRLRAEADGDS